jgi:hypothetical protein
LLEHPGVSLFDHLRTYTYYTLSAAGVRYLQPFFDQWGPKVRYETFSFGFVAGNAPAYTLASHVTLDEYQWRDALPVDRLGLLAHEMTHTVQMDRIGVLAFLARYMGEHGSPSNYDIRDLAPEDLTGPFNPLDPRYTFDQNAERTALQVQKTYLSQ